jgi:8-oxo-dGTP pyrophosphatase MutT (NUDIX family)
MEMRDQIRKGLSSLRLRTFEAGSDREAAVLMPVFERAGEPYFLLTRRTEDVQTHKGQISFPGGMREAGEKLEVTALRETREEVGIQPSSIELLGRFHDYRSTTGYLVTPFAGYLAEPFETIPEVREVAEILLVPFRVFLDPARLRIQQMQRLGQAMDVYFYSYGAHEIWGLTARIIRDFLIELNFDHP